VIWQRDKSFASAAFVTQVLSSIDSFGLAGRTFHFCAFYGELGSRGTQVVDELSVFSDF
jgi:hypothetical protein